MLLRLRKGGRRILRSTGQLGDKAQLSTDLSRDLVDFLLIDKSVGNVLVLTQ